MSAALDLRIPDFVGEVTGFRAWKVEWCGRVPALFSVVQQRLGLDHTIWPTNRWYEARCPKGHEADIPVEGCSCGLYAAKTVEQLVGLNYGAYGDDAEKVVGEVAFAGKVIEGSQGWRAEKGRIVRLWVPLHKWAWVEPLNRAYRVPVEMLDWRQFQSERGA